MNPNPSYPLPEQLLPHRAPILQIDFIKTWERDQYIEVIKKVEADNPFLQGHFPGYPIMPGVIIVEMMFQACGLYERLQSMEKSLNVLLNSSKGGRAVKINNVVFRNEVQPGASLTIKAMPARQLFKFKEFTVVVEDSVTAVKYVDGTVIISL